MTTIVTRVGKGSPLTWTEVDTNFTNLNSAKYESGNNATFGTIGGTTITASTGFSGALNGTVGASTPAAGTFTSLSDSGNLTFTGTGNRITGDFSNGTIASKVSFQSSTVNAASYPQVLPNGTSTNSGLLSFNNSDPTNAGFSSFLATSTDTRLLSGITGTGSYLPMTFYTGGSEAMRISTSRNVGIGTTSPDTFGRFSLYQGAGDTRQVIITDNNNAYDPTIAFLRTGVALWNIGMDQADSNKFKISTSSGYDISSGTVLAIDTSGNVGVGTSSPLTRLHTLVENAGTPTTSGSATTGVSARFQNSSVNFDIGTYANGTCFIQPRLNGDNASNFSLILNPNGGNVGIGTNSPTSGMKLDVVGGYIKQQTQSNSVTGNHTLIYTNSNASVDFGTYIDHINNGVLDARIQSGGAGGNTGLIVFNTNTAGNVATERMRIDSSGRLLVGQTSNTDSATLQVNQQSGGGNIGIETISSITATAYAMMFRNPNGQVGAISTSGTTTTFATSSDYRLKENIAPMTGALDKVAQLKPVTYTWKADGSDGQGFIAHELQEVVPDAVVGEKDAVDDEGNPKYQGIDTSFLVATLTAAIQELSAKVDTLQAELNTLKGN